jgi:hypothetical protein
MIHEAIYSLYPNVVAIYGAHDAKDANKNSVVIDMNAVNQEAERLQSEAQAQAEAKAQLRTSVINKIATNLTSEEKAWLEENL